MKFGGSSSTTFLALLLTALVANTSVSAYSVCADCYEVVQQEFYNNVGKGKHRTHEPKCNDGDLFYDMDCHKSSSKFSFTDVSRTVQDLGNNLVRFGAKCQVKANNVKVDVTLTAKVACYKPPKGSPVLSYTNQDGSGRKERTATCPSNTVLVGHYCYVTKTTNKLKSTNAIYKSASQFSGGGGKPVGRFPYKIECGWNAESSQTVFTMAIAYCMNLHDSKLKLDTAEIINKPQFRETNQAGTITAYCPSCKKTIAHRCETNQESTLNGYGISTGGRFLSCHFSNGSGSDDVAVAEAFCVSNTADLTN